MPVFAEADIINTTIDRLQEIKGNHAVEMIVVDGDSSGSTVNCITEANVIKLTSKKGRAIQMNLGAAQASGDILLFLHADTILPEKGFDKIKEMMTGGKYVAGAFNYAIESRHRFLRHIYYTSYLRSRITRIAYGDQAIFIRKDYFEKIGGYPEIPIMEDVELMKKIKKNKDEICILKEGVKTSTRRYKEEGVFYGWLRNHKVRFLYHLGVSPERLVKFYPDTRTRGKRECLILFLKYPGEGKVKTRLAKAVGNGLTLGLYECFIRDMLDKLEPLPYSLHLFVTPADRLMTMRQWLGKDAALHAQEGHDLGVRMQKAFEEMFRLGYESCVLIGCDLPDLPAAVLYEAFKELESSEAVIGPTKDGGYYLLGFQRSRFCKGVFHNIEWSTGTVFEKTMAVFKRENVRPAVVRQWWDVDDLEDLKDFFERNKTGDLKHSRTMKFLLQHERQVLKM